MQARVSDAEESEPPRRARRRFSGILESGHGSLSSESDEIERTTPAQRSKPKSTADTRKDGRSTSQSARRESTANVRRQRKQKGVLIAVCGMTGTGKSTFVGKVAGQAVDVGHGLKSRKLLHNDHLGKLQADYFRYRRDSGSYMQHRWPLGNIGRYTWFR